MDELFTINFDDEPEKGEKIPGRKNPAGDEIKNSASTNKPKVEFCTITIQEEPEKKITISPEKTLKIPVKDDFDWNDALAARRQINPVSQIPGKVKTMDGFYSKYGKPPSLTTKDILARQGNLQLPLRNQSTKKSFFDMASEYTENTHEKTEHISFMCYWPSYEYMSESQLNWYFYLRNCLRNGEYIDTDLSYLFVYIYEIINQIGVNDSDDGFRKMIEIWKNYRKAHDKLDRYLIDWAGDYIRFYNCDAGKSFELLEKEGLFLLMPADMLMEHYIKNDMILPLELITRFSDYKFYESEFIKSSDGNLFTDHLPGLFNKIRQHINQEKEGGFEAQFIPYKDIKHTKIPFLRAPFNNKTNTRLQVYLPYERHKPLRDFITSIVKEFENQLRTLKKQKGRLRPDKLSDAIINICKTYAKDAVSGSQTIQTVEIKIDRERLLALIQDSDEVRKKLIEGNYEYGGEPETSETDEIPPMVQEPDIIPATRESGNRLLPGLSPIQQKILDFLLARGGSSRSGEIGAEFQGTFVGVEIDKINDSALETIGDLLIGFEDERWYIMEEYINELRSFDDL
jgi:hypothetical protein